MDANKFLKFGCGGLAIVVTLAIVLWFVVCFGVLFYSASAVNSSNSKTIYIDIPTDSGTITVHTGMSKDSVLLLLGEPSSFHFGSNYSEHCEYRKFNNDGFSMIELSFENGKLTHVERR